ncbi:hypothetical protein F5Y04DRAFT_291046 [Hypomontagnella monticulosa]|nr:hypothetical protein F5Y04DRAFT_291046 [Hypomontagnella monticulosa]
MSQSMNAKPLPPAFHIYANFHSEDLGALGETESNLSHDISLGGDWPERTEINLHTSTRLLANASSFENSQACILLPSCSGSGADREPLYASHHATGSPFTFAIESGPGRRREAFEWRCSDGPNSPSQNTNDPEYELVRIATDTPSGLARAWAPGDATSSDGKEVVARITYLVRRDPELLAFKFLGTGVSGALGERWSVMAAATALSLWDYERRLAGKGFDLTREWPYMIDSLVIPPDTDDCES